MIRQRYPELADVFLRRALMERWAQHPGRRATEEELQMIHEMVSHVTPLLETRDAAIRNGALAEAIAAAYEVRQHDATTRAIAALKTEPSE